LSLVFFSCTYISPSQCVVSSRPASIFLVSGFFPFHAAALILSRVVPQYHPPAALLRVFPVYTLPESR
jgi:hypothetical protein